LKSIKDFFTVILTVLVKEIPSKLINKNIFKRHTKK